MRIVSLLPSATEIACVLGLREQLVGRSHECDFPPGVENLPVCTEARIDSGANSLEIDRQVKAILEQGVSVYEVYADVLRQLAPDVILTQAQCEVCAVSLKDVEKAICQWVGKETAIVSCSPMRLSDVYLDIQAVADACGVSERGRTVTVSLQERAQVIADRTAALPDKPHVACIEWLDPLMSGGNWVPELVEMAGGTSLFGTAGEHSPWLSWDALIAADPDVLVILPCGFGVERTRKEMDALTRHPAWPNLKAVREGRIYITDGNQYFNRPGPRLIESLEILAELFHPELFDFGHQGTAWTAFSNRLVGQS